MSRPTPAKGEFDLIRRYFAPLSAAAPGALGLRDDAALLTPPEGEELVLTADAQVEGVHFIGDEPPGDIAAKLLRTNLSDLAAMGATPLGYLLTTAWPRNIAEDWIAAFAAGLSEDQKRFGLALLGGDTVATPGPLTLSLTALGRVPQGQALRRSGGRVGDDVWVSGTIGDAYLGLEVARDALDALSRADREALLARYRRPDPRLALGERLRGLAHAAIDVSDGLLADLGHVAEACGIALEIEITAVPVSPAARRAGIATERLIVGGDDYELAFLAPVEAREAIATAGRQADVPLTRIGSGRPGGGVQVLRRGAPLALSTDAAGFRHF